MSHEPEYIECFYFVRSFDPIRKKWCKSRWRMTEEDAKSHFAGVPYEILWDTKEERTLGGDDTRICTSSFLKKPQQ